MAFSVDLSGRKFKLRETKDIVTKYNATLDDIQAALNAAGLGVLNIKGFHDASTGSYPSTPSANDAWIINVQGTISGTVYYVGNVIAYTGSAWVTVLKDAAQIAQGSVLSLLNPKAPSQAVHMTAASSGSNGIQVADDDDVDFGTGDLTPVWRGALPDYTPSETLYLIYKRQDAGNRFGLTLSSTGILNFFWTVSSVLQAFSSTVAIDAGAWEYVEIAVSVTRETASAAGSVTFYVNGVQLGDAVAITAASPPDISNTGVLSLCTNQAATGRVESRIQAAHLFNRALSASEVLDLYLNGVAYADKGGSQTATYTSDFSAGADGWIASGGTAAGNIDSIGGEDDWLRLTLDTGTSAHFVVRSSRFTTGKRYRLKFKYFIPAGQSHVDGIWPVMNSGNNGIGTAQSVAGTATSVETDEFVATGTDLRFYATDGGGTTITDPGGDDLIYVKEIEVIQVGATLSLDPEGINSTNWLDSSGNGNHASYPASGASLVRKEMVSLDAQQTLTNKTLTSPTISGGSANNMPLGASTANTVRGTTIEGTSTTDATSTTAAAMKTAGGLGVAKKIQAGDDVVMAAAKFLDMAANGALVKHSVTTGITAGSTQTQAGATALTTTINSITTVGTNGDGVKLPAAVKGRLCIVRHGGSANTAQIWPASGDRIVAGNTVGATDAVDPNSLAAGKTRIYWAQDDTFWSDMSFG